MGSAKKNVTLVLYEEGRTPKCFQLAKDQIKFLLWSIPVLCVISVLLALIPMINKSVNKIKLEEIKIPNIAKNKTENAESIKKLEMENLQLKQEYDQLVEKMSQQVSGTSSAPIFGGHYVTTPQNSKDLRDSSPLKISELNKFSNAGKIELHFNMQPKDESVGKISGHILVVMKTNNSISFYPSVSQSWTGPLTSFNKGEPFTMQRLRPVVAKFNIEDKNAQNTSFLVLIYDRVGDLIFGQEVNR